MDKRDAGQATGATAGPWRTETIYRDNAGYTERIAIMAGAASITILYGSQIKPGARSIGQARADAALICEAVNGRAALLAERDALRAALRLLSPWTMRDGTPCWCPAGTDEDERRGRMPTMHSTACEAARAALAAAKGGAA